MWKKTYSKEFKGVCKQDVWNMWKDINNWPKWHEDLESCKLAGDFAVGNHFYLKPKGMKPIKIDLTKVDEENSFTDCTNFFGAKMYDIHYVEDIADGVRIKNELVVKGPLKWLWVLLVARDVAKGIAPDTEALVKRARRKYE